MNARRLIVVLRDEYAEVATRVTVRHCSPFAGDEYHVGLLGMPAAVRGALTEGRVRV